MASILVRTIIIYILLSFSLRIMGKRQLGEMDVVELVSTLLISELASIPIDDPDIPLLNAIIPILLILSAEVILSTVKNKSEKLKESLEGKPLYIIYKGRLLQDALRENRISVNELLSEMRSQGIGDISEVNYAILEQNGSLSLLKKAENDMAHTLVIDGHIMVDDLKSLGYNERWLEKEVAARKTRLEKIFLMTVTDEGDVNIILKEEKRG
ncbi:MAG: DUF421 domain-containing protein [Ruminococcaceae bacterium]|nr:DUF421 domain-containing protein [Oscillospiraceae bacterium]